MPLEFKRVSSTGLNGQFGGYVYNGKFYTFDNNETYLTIYQIDLKTGERTIYKNWTELIPIQYPPGFIVGKNNFLYALGVGSSKGLCSINLDTGTIRQITISGQNYYSAKAYFTMGDYFGVISWSPSDNIGSPLYVNAFHIDSDDNISAIPYYTIGERTFLDHPRQNQVFNFDESGTTYFINSINNKVLHEHGVFKMALNIAAKSGSVEKMLDINVSDDWSQGNFKYDNTWYFNINGSPNLWAYNPVLNTLVDSNISREDTITGFYDNGVNLVTLATDYLLLADLIPQNNTYRIANGAGSEIYLTSAGNSPIVSVQFVEFNNVVTYTIHTMTATISGTYTSNPPPNKRVTGYAFVPNAPRREIPTGEEQQISVEGDATFYEVYSIYNPPATTFDINLYQSSAEPNRVDKTNYLSAIGTLAGALRQPSSIINPSITIYMEGVPTFNYVYIGIFHRYYFVTGITSIAQNLWRIDMRVDVLMTWRTQINNLQAIIARQENSYNLMLVDSEIPAQNNQVIEVEQFPAGGFITSTLLNRNFVLTVVGA